MEIGALGFLVLLSIITIWGEHSKSGDRFFNWFSKKFLDIDLDAMED